jgi:hypothetical protein
MRTKLLVLFTMLFGTSIVHTASANNMLVQNVTTLGNDPVNKTIQVQFDISWDNSWRDDINYDAAWIFMKFKDANGLWQHAQLNQTGFANGTGTANTVQVTSDKVGSWLYRSAQGSGTFNTTGMQLQWNYGLAGLTNVTGLEVRVFAVEMVYVPEGDFNCANFFNSTSTCTFTASGNNLPVINSKLSPTLIYSYTGSNLNIRIKGDAGLDTDNNGVVDNQIYPIGYPSFYCLKYELSEQQYADFLNTLTSSQIANIGVAGFGITLANGQYFSSTPNRACGNSTNVRFFSFCDWSGLRPLSLLEFNKVSYGPIKPVYLSGGCGGNIDGYPASGSTSGSINTFDLLDVAFYTSATSNRIQSGASYYGVINLSGNAHEPIVSLDYLNFSTINGNGFLSLSGSHDVQNWNSISSTYIDVLKNVNYNCVDPQIGYYNAGGTFTTNKYGFRYCRSAE